MGGAKKPGQHEKARQELCLGLISLSSTTDINVARSIAIFWEGVIGSNCVDWDRAPTPGSVGSFTVPPNLVTQMEKNASAYFVTLNVFFFVKKFTS